MCSRWVGLCAGCAVFMCVLCTHSDASPSLVLGPYVQDVQADGFSVVFDTDQPVLTTVTAGERSVASEGAHHVARLRGLAAGTQVAYRVILDGKEVAGGRVALPDRARPLTFLVYGDTRNNELGGRLVELARALAPDLILHTGDLVPHGNDVQAWHKFFREEESLLADVPLYPALGNHELARDGEAASFRRYFALPGGDGDRLYYAFRFGPAQFLVLDGNHPDAAQTAWLAAQLEAARAAAVGHVFVLLHQPPLSVGSHCGDGLAQAEWVELFERYRVRAVFAGHDHAYERLERNGVRYFISGGGGAPLYHEEECAEFDRAARRVYRRVHHLLRVRVSGGDVSVEALPLDGSAPLEVVRFAAGEPMFATDAPRLRAAPSVSRWILATAGALLVAAAVWLRRRRRRPAR